MEGHMSSYFTIPSKDILIGGIYKILDYDFVDPWLIQGFCLDRFFLCVDF